MKHKNLFTCLIIITIGVLMLSGCGPGAPPEALAGTWVATSQHGNFTFTVNAAATGITVIEYQAKITPECNKAMLSGSMTLNETINFSQDLPIANGAFNFPGPPEIKGKFNRSGTSASGTWTVGDCNDKWAATR